MQFDLNVVVFWYEPTNTTKGIQSLESVKKFACKVCLKQWDMNYENMLEQLDLTPLSQR